ncbi:MAG: hypothetical protein KJN71_02660 [Acidimicrobiia bacterium]|nr:hypothetical protein [Acidimicrobiia bacterium]
MTKVLDRETTGSTLERPVEAERPVEIQPQPQLATPRQPYVRWIGWMFVVAVIAMAGILVAIQGNDAVVTDDGSFEANELARMMQLAPAIETSFAASGFAGDASSSHLRTWTSAPGVSDGSFAAITFANDAYVSHMRPWMQAVLPIQALRDTSFETNELARMLTLAPTVDTSFEANELARMLALAAEVSDGSFEANELARMLRLAPDYDASFETNELERMTNLDPEG